MTAPDHAAAVDALMSYIDELGARGAVTAVGHRVVHGGPEYSAPQRITADMIEDLRALSPFAPVHLPEEILLIEAFCRRLAETPQWPASGERFLGGLDAEDLSTVMNSCQPGPCG